MRETNSAPGAPLFAAERQARILDDLIRDGRVEVPDLARRLGVSEPTVRRDLRVLSERGYLLKTHGGAVGLDAPHLGWAARSGLHAEPKARIGAAAARLVEPGQTVILDAGSTVLEMARCLRVRPLTVVTNSLDTAAVLEASPGVSLTLTGGEWDPTVRHLGGPAALAMLALCRADWVFLGVSAVHPSAGVTSVYAENAAVKRAMVAVAERAVVLADGSKIGQVAPHLIARLGSIHALVTDAGAGVAQLEAVGLKAIVADP